ncbi:hypothetical protein HDU93_005412 [Gonapodya sp. JEL0774]|nr:hypothetical protein HDU93_005412 [Gonapodya sp. JEL0774]
MSSSGANQRGQEKYKPSEHGGMKEDGTPDKRVKQFESEAHKVNTEELAHGSHHSSKVETEEGKTGAQVGGEHNAGTGKYKPTEHDGLKEDGTPDRRTKMGEGARE